MVCVGGSQRLQAEFVHTAAYNVPHDMAFRIRCCGRVRGIPGRTFGNRRRHDAGADFWRHCLRPSLWEAITRCTLRWPRRWLRPHSPPAPPVREHHKHDAVDWGLVKRFVPGMVTGSLIATFASGWVSQRTLALSFAVIVFAAAINMLVGKRNRRPPARCPAPGIVRARRGDWCGFRFGVCGRHVSADARDALLPRDDARPSAPARPSAFPSLPLVRWATSRRVGAYRNYRTRTGFVYLPALVGLVVWKLFTARWGRAPHIACQWPH